MVGDKHQEEIEFAKMFLSGDYLAEKNNVFTAFNVIDRPSTMVLTDYAIAFLNSLFLLSELSEVIELTNLQNSLNSNLG